MSTTKRPSLTRLLGTKNAADFNLLLTSELCLNGETLKSCNNALEQFVEFLKSKLEGQEKFKEILVGGSLGTQTEVDNDDDLDASLHIMLDYGSDDVSSSVTEFKETLSDFIQNLKGFIEAYGDGAEIDDVTSTSISCTLAVADSPIDVEVEILPSLSWDVENEEKRDTFYEQMIANNSDRRYYATSLCRLQINYIKELKNPRVKNLIRLIKFWRQRAFSEDNDKCILPSPYLLQLLVIHSWEKAGKPEMFKPSAGFRAVMEEINNYTDMYVVWNVNYDKEKVQRALVNPRRPILVDPSDPTRNIAAECNCWNDVATVALATLGKPIIKDVTLTPRWQ